MSSASESSPVPASETAPASPTATSPAGEEEAKLRPSQRIKIGSERPGASPYTPKPVATPAAAPPASPAPPTPSAVPAADAAASGAPAATGEAAPAPAAGGGDRPQGDRGPGGHGDRGRGRGGPGGGRGPRRGPRNDGGQDDRVFAQQAAPTPTVPKPNLREALSPELEAELAEALGDQSIDQIITAGGKSVGGEGYPPDTRVRGQVVQVHRDSVFLDLGGPDQGILPLKQFAPDAQPAVGDLLEVLIDRFDEAQQCYLVRKPGATVSASADWAGLAEGMIVEARITGQNKGGLEAQVGALKGFIPVSQIALFRVENLEEFVGQKWPCVITECKPEKRNLVLSRRAILEREKEESREKLLGELAPGQVREGTVRTVKDFGAFVDLGGVDGLLHVGQLSWARVNHPSEMLKVGQKVQVKIQKIDPETHKISLSMRELSESPWSSVEREFHVGQIIKGKVTKIMDFGAFVEIAPGVEGMIHISELSHGRVWRVSDVLKEGQDVEVKLLSLDKEKQRISLSLKATIAKEEKKPQAQEEPEPEPTPVVVKRKGPLKGGLGKSTGGESVGLNW